MSYCACYKRRGMMFLTVLCTGLLVACAAHSSGKNGAESMPEHLGVHDGMLAPMPSTPNAVSSQTTISSKFVEPLPMKGTVDETRNHILATLKAMQNNTVTHAEGTYVHTVFISSLFRFRDDVEFYIDATAGVVHFRSASRIGYTDFGANSRRYERFRRMYLEE